MLAAQPGHLSAEDLESYCDIRPNAVREPLRLSKIEGT